MMRSFFYSIVICLLSFNAYGQNVTTPKKISASKLERKLKKDIQLVDVRTEKEFKEQHLDKAININVEDADFEKSIQALDKTKPVYLYCRSGKRSDKAAQKMASMGFTKIYDLKGGILSWNAKQAKN